MIMLCMHLVFILSLQLIVIFLPVRTIKVSFSAKKLVSRNGGDTVATLLSSFKICPSELVKVAALLNVPEYSLSCVFVFVERVERIEMFSQFVQEKTLHNTVFSPLKLLVNPPLARKVFLLTEPVNYSGLFDGEIPIEILADVIDTFSDRSLARGFIKYIIETQMGHLKSLTWVTAFLCKQGLEEVNWLVNQLAPHEMLPTILSQLILTYPEEGSILGKYFEGCSRNGGLLLCVLMTMASETFLPQGLTPNFTVPLLEAYSELLKDFNPNPDSSPNSNYTMQLDVNLEPSLKVLDSKGLIDTTNLEFDKSISNSFEPTREQQNFSKGKGGLERELYDTKAELESSNDWALNIGLEADSLWPTIERANRLAQERTDRSTWTIMATLLKLLITSEEEELIEERERGISLITKDLILKLSPITSHELLQVLHEKRPKQAIDICLTLPLELCPIILVPAEEKRLRWLRWVKIFFYSSSIQLSAKHAISMINEDFRKGKLPINVIVGSGGGGSLLENSPGDDIADFMIDKAKYRISQEEFYKTQTRCFLIDEQSIWSLSYTMMAWPYLLLTGRKIDLGLFFPPPTKPPIHKWDELFKHLVDNSCTVPRPEYPAKILESIAREPLESFGIIDYFTPIDIRKLIDSSYDKAL